jgi:hypothetical protein
MHILDVEWMKALDEGSSFCVFLDPLARESAPDYVPSVELFVCGQTKQ